MRFAGWPLVAGLTLLAAACGGSGGDPTAGEQTTAGMDGGVSQPATTTTSIPRSGVGSSVERFGTAAEATRDALVAMLVADGWSDIGGDHDVAGSATFGVEDSDGAFVTGSVLLGATQPVGDTPVTATTTISGHEVSIVGERATFAVCGDVGIRIAADTVELSSELLLQALDLLAC